MCGKERVKEEICIGKRGLEKKDVWERGLEKERCVGKTGLET